MTVEMIEAAIPHRPPMRLLDEVLQREGNQIVCRKTFLADEFFLQGHFPARPIVPGVILMECCMQAGAVLLSQLHPLGEGFLPLATRADNVKFKNQVGPGDSVKIEVRLQDQVANAYFLTGRVVLKGKLATRLDFACTLAATEST